MTVVVVGNPKPASRTRRAAELVAERLTGEPPATATYLWSGLNARPNVRCGTFPMRFARPPDATFQTKIS